MSRLLLSLSLISLFALSACSSSPSAENSAGDEFTESTPTPSTPSEGADRVQCEPDMTCPAGMECNEIQCVRAPCPSFCEPTGDTPAPGTVGAACGSRGLSACDEGLTCVYPMSAQCGETDKPGYCTGEPPVACTMEYRPVCGCDGQTYPNSCAARAASASIRSEGSCEEGAAAH